MDGFFGNLQMSMGGFLEDQPHKSTKKLVIRTSGSTLRVLYYYILLYTPYNIFVYIRLISSFLTVLAYFFSVASTVGRSNDFCFYHGDDPSSKMGFMRLLGVPLVELVVP